MMACGELYLSVGTVIIDDIILPDGEARMARLGGGAVHAVMGMRLWNEHVGLAAPLGKDFPPALRQELADRFDLQGVRVRTMPAPRSWQLFENDGTRHEVFRTDFSQMQLALIRPDEYPSAYWAAKGIHLHCAAHEVPQWVGFLKAHGQPVILWEPWDPIMVPENRELFRCNAALVDVVSPNLPEGRLLTGKTDPARSQALLDLGARCVALRMGEREVRWGRGRRRVWIPGVHFGEIVERDRPGNAYSGGFVGGLGAAAPQQAGVAGLNRLLCLAAFGAVYDVEGLLKSRGALEIIFSQTPSPRAALTHGRCGDRIASQHLTGWQVCTDSSGGDLSRGKGAGYWHRHSGCCCRPIAPGAVLAMIFPGQAAKSAQQPSPLVGEARVAWCKRMPYICRSGGSFSAVYSHGVFPPFSPDFRCPARVVAGLLPGGRLVNSHAIGHAGQRHSRPPWSGILRVTVAAGLGDRVVTA